MLLYYGTWGVASSQESNSTVLPTLIILQIRCHHRVGRQQFWNALHTFLRCQKLVRRLMPDRILIPTSCIGARPSIVFLGMCSIFCQFGCPNIWQDFINPSLHHSTENSSRDWGSVGSDRISEHHSISSFLSDVRCSILPGKASQLQYASLSTRRWGKASGACSDRKSVV